LSDGCFISGSTIRRYKIMLQSDIASEKMTTQIQ